MSSAESSTAPIPARKPSLFWTVIWGYLMLTIFITFGIVFIGRDARDFENADVVREKERIKIREEVLAAGKKEMNEGPTWISKEKGTIHLPINEAMALTVERLKIKKPRAANPIETPAAAPAAAPAPATGAAAPAASPAAAAPAGSPAPAPAPAPAAPPK
jgi:hypothetical protein